MIAVRDDPDSAVRSVIDTLRAHGGTDQAWIAEALEAVRSGGDFAKLIGLRPLQSRTPAVCGVLDQRNDLIRAVAVAYFSEASFPSKLIADELTKYAGSVWQMRHRANDCPHRKGSLQSYFWQILKLNRKPIGEKQIRRILRT